MVHPCAFCWFLEPWLILQILAHVRDTEVQHSDPPFQKCLLTSCGKYDRQAVSSCQPHCVLPQLPRPVCPTVTTFLGSLHLVMGSLRSSACSRALFRLPKVVPGMIITELLPLPNSASTSSIYRYWSLINTLYPKHHLTLCSGEPNWQQPPTRLNVKTEKSKKADYMWTMLGRRREEEARTRAGDIW